MLTYLFAALAVVLAAALAWSWLNFAGFKAKYTPITDIEGEVSKLEGKRASIETERARLEDDVRRARSAEEARRQKFEASLREQRQKCETEIQQSRDAFNAKYSSAKETLERLQKEVGLLEENLEDISYGIYKPHYAFDTSAEYKAKLDGNYEHQKAMVKNSLAVMYGVEWTVNNSKTEGRKMQKQYGKLMLRAFNGECDAAIAKVTWNNATRMEERVNKTFEAVNSLGSVMSISVNREYLNLRLAELHLSHEYEEKKHAEVEEQRRIRAQIREEEREQKELEAARQKADAEEERYSKALEQARAEVTGVSGDKLDKLNDKIHELEQQLTAAQQKQRAISQAQLTKSGHIYVISNIGSFGEDIFKIGMTRRLEPLERVQELGDASVPFSFDVHAMIPSDNAPALEHEIHQHFSDRQLNRINTRKEFFRLSLDELGKFLETKNVRLQLTALAEAREYRETLAMIKQAQVEAANSHVVGTVAEPASATEQSSQFPASVL